MNKTGAKNFLLYRKISFRKYQKKMKIIKDYLKKEKKYLKNMNTQTKKY